MINKEQIDINSLSLPDELFEWIDHAPIYESSGKSGARTVYIDRDDGAYLKIADKGSLLRSYQMQTLFSKHKLSSDVLLYRSADRDYMITAAIKGEDGISEKHLAEPERLSEIFGQSLRCLHEVDIKDFPINDNMDSLIHMAGSCTFLQTHLDDLAEYIGEAHADSAFKEINTSKGLLKRDVLTHGDYCLPNIILNHWSFAGFIDLNDAGLGDQHYDLAWGLWTLKHNLNSSTYGHRFLDAYGRDLIDKDRLRICGLLAAI